MGVARNDWNTVGAAMATVFPNGTRGDSALRRLPLMPADVFALAAYLVERGGVYHRIIPPWVEPAKRPNGKQTEDSLNLWIEKKEWDRWYDLGRKWRDQARRAETAKQKKELRNTHAAIEKEFWSALREHSQAQIVVRPRPTTALPWWKPAVGLMVIADEASTGFGYLAENAEDDNPFELLFRSVLADQVAEPETVQKLAQESRAKQESPARDFRNFIHHFSDDDPQGGTTTVHADPYVVRVLPKCRTPVVGCTMRSLTHNLALVPPSGIVDFGWSREIAPRKIRRGGGPDRANNEAFNVLLVPFPYHVSAECFEPQGDRLEASQVLRKGYPVDTWPPRPQSRFKLTQRWLGAKDGAPARGGLPAGRAEVVDFLLKLLESAGVGVHGLVLPELALDWPTYDHLVRRAGVELKHPPDFIVCGLSKVEDEIAGNYVATTIFEFPTERPASGEPRVAWFARTLYRQKHHRWLLSGAQIKDYGLAPMLDPNLGWWESIETPRRKVDLVVYRRAVIFSAMICEDLARNEPCHEPLKAIGPNLVFALLMDGPQLKERWSARYATVLADDPGSSVLTLTSLGLINRQNDTGHYPPSRVIGLWKDDTGNTVQINCPKGAGGVLVTLASEPATETTMDGRANGDTVALRYHGQQPVWLRLPRDQASRYDWILDGTTPPGETPRREPLQRAPGHGEGPVRRDLPPGRPGLGPVS